MNSNKRKKRKIFFLFVVITITTIVLITETYAWFVGTSTVTTNEFTVSVNTDPGLEISLDGSAWKSGSNKLTISDTAITTGLTAYSTNTNKWPASGLSPVSSSGVLDTTTGRLKLFEKTSLSATQGGYRLIANAIDNSTTEQDGYIVFDLFIRNGKGASYNGDNSTSAAENIYLTKNSSATYNGTNNGAANSVRVGFFSLANIKSSGASIANIQALSCSTANSSTTKKLCPAEGSSKALYWNIWEPNYNSHTQALVNYYNNACKKRNTSTGEYLSDACTQITTTTERNTYSVYHAVASSGNVDIYDGLNGYTANTTSIYSSTSTSPLLSYTSYKITSSTAYTQSNQLIKLAGNSITKVRVYIWLEGQDIDNYDLIAGNTIKINFGFTKDRYGIENT